VDNTYRDVIFSFGNEVARICDAAGINAYEVINGGKLGYPRTNVALPGLVGGPCLEKDPHILNQSAKLYGLDGLDVTVSARKVNERQPKETVDFIAQAFKNKYSRNPKSICIAGLTFKGYPETDDLRGSMALDILAELKSIYPDAHFSGFDPQLNQNIIQGLGLHYQPTLASAAQSNELIVITNNHPVFKKTSWAQLFDQYSDLLVYDYWNSFNAFDWEAYSDRYIVLGNHSAFLRQLQTV
jgi:UDP-N-acetyl-D-mannosaminuronic acid dehydrogenase